MLSSFSFFKTLVIGALFARRIPAKVSLQKRSGLNTLMSAFIDGVMKA
jgi:hypothetical protein